MGWQPLFLRAYLAGSATRIVRALGLKFLLFFSLKVW